MAATNRERQAAFKRNMRDAGMRQVTIWLDPNQEQEVKALLSGSRQDEAESIRLANWAERLAQEQHQLDTRRNELDALVAETNLLKDNLKKRERDVSLKPKTASTATQEEMPSHADRVARLVEWFTTRKDWRSGEQQSLTDSYSALNKAAEMVSLSRQTKAAGTAIKSLLSTYGEEQHALLNTSETSVLKSALSVLNRLGEAAGDAKDRVNRTAKRVKAEEESRYKAAHAAIKAAFPDMQMTDAILLLCHMGDGVNYELLKVARTKPSGTDWAFDFMSDVRDMQRAAIDGAEMRVRNAMLKDGSTAPVAATALRSGFDVSKAELLARQESLVKHAVFATPDLASRLGGNFLSLLDGASLLIPGEDSALRDPLMRWLERGNLRPRIVGEFDDSALMMAFGKAGAGVFPARSATRQDVEDQYGMVMLGETKEIRERFFAISVERKIGHPAVRVVIEGAHGGVFAKWRHEC